jgi:hypothetical protein
VGHAGEQVFKNFAIAERANFQFRAEAFNAFNRPIYRARTRA